MHFILHAENGFNWGTFHPSIVHFPIVLFTGTLVCDLLFGIGKRGAYAVGTWMLTLGILLAIPTTITGLEATVNFPIDDPQIWNHKFYAFVTVIYATGYAIIRWTATIKPYYLHPVIVVLLSVVLVGLTFKTSDYGGLITHGQTPFSVLFSKPSNLNHIDH